MGLVAACKGRETDQFVVDHWEVFLVEEVLYWEVGETPSLVVG